MMAKKDTTPTVATTRPSLQEHTPTTVVPVVLHHGIAITTASNPPETTTGASTVTSTISTATG